MFHQVTILYTYYLLFFLFSRGLAHPLLLSLLLSTKSLAVEYGLGNEVSTQGDVYSYGIILLEMFTGKRPTDEMFSENMNLNEYVKKALPDEVEEIADPMLLEELQLHNAQASTSSRKGRLMECLVSVFQVGVSCSSEVPRQRMDMAGVAAELNSIRKMLGGREGPS